MRSGSVLRALTVSLALLTGCGPRKPAAPVSPAAQVPDLPPARMAMMLPAFPPPFPPTNSRVVKLDTTTPPEVKTEVAAAQPRKPAKKHTKSGLDEAVKTPSNPPQAPAQTAQMAPAQPPEQTPLGQLSTPNDSVNTADKSSISGRIDSTENGLNAIKRSLNADEQKTVTLIRQYITRARDALKNDDLDGANNLSTKAQQMLQELTKP